jgi:hypothetical protein
MTYLQEILQTGQEVSPSLSLSVVSAINLLVAFYDIHGRKAELLSHDLTYKYCISVWILFLARGRGFRPIVQTFMFGTAVSALAVRSRKLSNVLKVIGWVTKI